MKQKHIRFCFAILFCVETKDNKNRLHMTSVVMVMKMMLTLLMTVVTDLC